MTPAEWLAGLFLGWQVVGGLWDLLDPSAVKVKYKPARLVATFALLCSLSVLASIVLFGAAWAGAVVILAAIILGVLSEGL